MPSREKTTQFVRSAREHLKTAVEALNEAGVDLNAAMLLEPDLGYQDDLFSATTDAKKLAQGARTLYNILQPFGRY